MKCKKQVTGPESEDCSYPQVSLRATLHVTHIVFFNEESKPVGVRTAMETCFLDLSKLFSRIPHDREGLTFGVWLPGLLPRNQKRDFPALSPHSSHTRCETRVTTDLIWLP